MSVHKKKRYIVVLLTVCILCAVFFAIYKRQNYIPSRIITAIDQRCSGEGECSIDLAEVFTGFDWDTVSIFMAGNTRQIEDALGVYTEISDGIVFSKDGDPVLTHMSFYQFPQDVPADISYYVHREKPSDPYYVSLPFQNAIVHAEKYMYNDDYKYTIYAD